MLSQLSMTRSGSSSRRVRCRFGSDLRGFTLIELVVSIILMGIMAAIAIPKMVNLKSMSHDAAYQRIMSNIRLAQNIAITHHQEVFVFIDIYGDKVEVSTGSPGSWTILDHPSTHQPLEIQLNSGIYEGVQIGTATISSQATPSGADGICFTPMGTPYAATKILGKLGTAPTFEPMKSGLIQVTCSGETAKYVRIKAISGLVTD